MPSEQLQKLIDALESHNYQPKSIGNGQYRSLCPGHKDNSPSLDFQDGFEVVLLRCRSQMCEHYDIISPLGLTARDLRYNVTTSDNEPLPYKRKEKESAKKGFAREKEKKETDQRSTKRQYKDLTDYASFQGFPLEVFLEKGWEDWLYLGKYKCARIKTKGGYKYRLFNNSDNKFAVDKEPKFEKSWYLLDNAIIIAKKNNQSLIFCNGESATVIAQHLNLPAFAICAS